MPAASNVVINDGASTPVAHTFTPLGKDEKGVMWFEQTTPTPANPLAAKRLGYRQTRGFSPGSGNSLVQQTKVVGTVYLPTLETLGTNDAGLTPPPTLAYQQVCRFELTLPERGSKQERDDVRSLTMNWLAHAMMVSAIDDLQPTY